MSTDERKVQLGVGVDATTAKAGFNEVKQSARDMAQSVANEAGKAAKGIDKIGSGGSEAADKVDRATRNIVAAVQRATAAVQAGERDSAKFFETLANQRGANVETLRPYLEQLDAAKRKAAEASSSLNNMGVSAAQTAAALRGVPAQFTDIATSLAGGQAPLTVFLQQGGQLKDMFGGAAPAAKALGGYVAGLVNPTTLAAAAVGALGYAYLKGSEEAAEFRRQIILSGNAAGVTSGQLAGMASDISTVVGTQGKAAEVLAQLVGTGRVARDELERVGAAIVAMEKAGGAAAKELVKDFAELGKTPVEAVRKLNEEQHFLTQSLYEQIIALERQGKSSEAAALAQKAYADAVKARAAELQGSLGLLESSWQKVADGAKAAWDSMLGVGRPDTAEDRLTRVRRLIATKESSLPGLQGTRAGDLVQSELAGLRQDELRLREESLRSQAAAADRAARQRVEDAGIAATKALEDQRKALATGARKIEQELSEYRQRIEAIRMVNPSSALLDPEKIAADEKGIRDKYKDKDAQKQITEAQKALEKYRNLVSDLSVREDGLAANFGEQVATLSRGWKMSGDSIDVYNKAFDELLKRQPFAVKQAKELAEAEQQWQEARKRRFADVERQFEQEVRGAEQSAKSVGDRVQAMKDEEAALSKATAANITLAQAIEAVRIARLEDARGQELAKADGSQEKVDAINKEIAARRELAALTGRKEARDKSSDAFNDLMKADISTDFAAGFDKASQSLGVFTQSFGKLIDQQKKYNLAKQAQGKTAEEMAQLDQRYARSQLSSYAAMTGAAKGFFAEKTAGYKTLTVLEQGLRAAELASSVSSIAAAGARTAAKATEALVSQLSLPFPANVPAFAATAAVLGALGVAVAGGFGGGGSFAPTNTGTGTVLGDSGAGSKSLAQSIDALRDVDTQGLRYSAQMLASLLSIQGSIGGLAAAVAQSTGINASAAGVETGFQRDALGNGIAGYYGVVAKLESFIPVVGGLLSGVTQALGGAIGNLFGTKTSIQAQGLTAGAQSLQDILAGGFQAQYFTDIEKKKKTLGITTKTSRSTQYADADAQVEQQISTVFAGFASAVQAASVPLGLSLDVVKARLSGFVVDIGRIDFKGLSGAEIQERLSAVFSAQGDRLASAVLGGFEAFQKVGEGYLQTIVRVASGLEEGRSALRRLGVAAVDLTSIANKQADVAAELVRQSVLAAEGLSGIGDVIKSLTGSASEIASVYDSLTDVRLSLKVLGLDASSVGADLVDGAGGLQALVDAVGSFESGFLGKNDQVTVKAERMAAEFAKLGLALPSTSDAFVSLVKGIDTSSESGRRLLGGVLNLSGGFSDLLKAITDVGSGIADEIKRIKGLSASGSAQSLAELQASFAINTAQARSGNQNAIDLLPQISQALLKAAETSAKSSLDIAVLRAQTLSSLQATLDAITDPTKRLPKFASGGDFTGGWRIVGEKGPELEATGSARIFNAADTARMLSAGGSDDQLIAEVRALRAEVAALRSDQANQSLAQVMVANRTANVLERCNQDGATLSVNTVTS